MASIKPKICFVVTSEMSVNAFLLNHLKALAQDHEVTVITNTSTPEFLMTKGIEVQVIPLNIERHISLLSDIKVLFKLVLIMKKNQYASIHSVTPKAGLLSMVAAWLNRVPIRIHTFTGQIWANKTGLKRLLLKNVDGFFAALATHNIVDSPSQRDFLTAENVLNPKKCIVFGEGSIAGVDLKKFKQDLSIRKELRFSLGVADNAVLCLFLGRLNIDKGVLDLAKAFVGINAKKERKKAVLLFVGPDEQGMQARIQTLDGFKATNILFIDYTTAPQDFMAAADFLCLPSYREGFGSVIIEAAATGIPSLASRIYGITDAIVDHETGLFHEPGNIVDIKEKLQVLVQDGRLRKKLGEAALLRAKLAFNADKVTEAWVNFYREVL